MRETDGVEESVDQVEREEVWVSLILQQANWEQIHSNQDNVSSNRETGVAEVKRETDGVVELMYWVVEERVECA